jgi:hypothetical protein
LSVADSALPFSFSPSPAPASSCCRYARVSASSAARNSSKLTLGAVCDSGSVDPLPSRPAVGVPGLTYTVMS